MRAYLQLFFGLLVPLSGLFIVASVIYFRIEYDFTKAMRIGVLSGFFIALVVSLITALFLLIVRKLQSPQEHVNSHVKHKKRTTSKTHQIVNEAEILEKTSTESLSPLSTTKTIMLLMDKSIAFEVLLYAVSEKHIGTLTESKEAEGEIVLKTKEGIIRMLITPLTKHTAQIVLSAKTKTKYIEQIIEYVKKKEYSFTQY